MRTDPNTSGAGDRLSDIRVLQDVVYGRGLVQFSRPEGPVPRDLTMDIYLPSAGDAPSGALLFAFGGGFHRGSKSNDAFYGESGNTSVAEYCRRAARRGHVAIAVDYRLVPEDPDPGTTQAVLDADTIPRGRIDEVRRIMGLPPATNEMLRRGIEAASDDMAMAIRFVRSHASNWEIDPTRIAIGGFSAGARTALNAAFAEKVQVKSVVAMSGAMEPADRQRHVRPGQSGPPVLFISAENDLDAIRQATPGLVRHFRDAGLSCEYAQVRNANHFYPAHAIAVHDTGEETTVEEAVMSFLDRTLRGPESRERKKS